MPVGKRDFLVFSVVFKHFIRQNFKNLLNTFKNAKIITQAVLTNRFTVGEVSLRGFPEVAFFNARCSAMEIDFS